MDKEIRQPVTEGETGGEERKDVLESNVLNAV
ncbi:MAG: hypothetical protein Ct9H300mP28_31190 [Pseudomonadota bacterium]|nr:MAG: hypothetical protein Ct9H300mP28_31190 [Pseudomonadota bacterium]